MPNQHWWDALPLIVQAFWTIALVGTMLWFIYLGVLLQPLTSSPRDQNRRKPTLGIISGGSTVTFLAAFGWLGLYFLTHDIKPKTAIVLSAILALVVDVLLIGWVYWRMGRFARKRVLPEHPTLYQTARVQISVPANRNGMGKVQLQLREGTHELNAITDGDSIPSGVTVHIVDIVDNETIIVEPDHWRKQFYPNEGEHSGR